MSAVDKHERINAYLNVCHPAPHGFVGPSHLHRDSTGQIRAYVGLACPSLQRTRPMEVTFDARVLKHQG